MASTNIAEGLQSSAILLLALGEDCAAEVIKHLTPKEVQRVGESMTRLTTVADAEFDQVLSRFESTVESHRSLVNNSSTYVSNVLKRALGEEKAGLLLDRILQTSDVSGIDNLKWMDAAMIAELMSSEHPQIVATVLVHLDRDQACGVLQALSPQLRNDVLLRIATLDRIQPSAMKELNEVLSRIMDGGQRTKKSLMDGVKTVAEMLNLLGNQMDEPALESIRATDSELAQKIEEQMFTFSDLLKLDNKGMQRLLRDVPSEQLVVALKGADPGMRERVFSNMSSRAAETLREDLESRGPVRLTEVEAQQKEIVALARRLADEGEIMMGGGGADFV